MRIRVMVGAVCFLALGACASNDDQRGAAAASTTATTVSPTTTVAPTTTLEPGIERFMAEVIEAGPWRSIEIPTDAPEFRKLMLSQGNRTCDYAPVIGYGGLIQGTLESKLTKSERQASALVKSSIRNLCPQHRDLLP